MRRETLIFMVATLLGMSLMGVVALGQMLLFGFIWLLFSRD